MPLIETKGAASSQGFGQFSRSGPVAYIEEVFSTYLYQGDTTYPPSVPNSVDLLTKGGMVWLKNRSSTQNHFIVDTARGLSYSNTSILIPNTGDSQVTGLTNWAETTTTGFNIGSGSYVSSTGTSYVSWTFRKQPKFFDIVTYTGTGSNRTIAHNLGSVPGCIIVKDLGFFNNWAVYHQSIGAGNYLALNSNGNAVSNSTFWNNTSPTDTQFSVGTSLNTNGSGRNYIAYLFAHNSGGFGASGSENAITCGSYTGNGSTTGPIVTLGYEPQWLLIKNTSSTDSWQLVDNMRGLNYISSAVSGADALLVPNSTFYETYSNVINPLSNGFQLVTTDTQFNGNMYLYSYIAIRRGPMKIPTSGTNVLSAYASLYSTTTQGNNQSNSGYPVPRDLLIMFGNRTSPTTPPWIWADRLRGYRDTGYAVLDSASTAAEIQRSSDPYFATNTSVQQTNFSPSISNIVYGFLRAPGFFDEVCYTGTGSGPLYVPHNLGVVPEFIIIKTRNTSSNWVVGQGPAFYISQLYLDSNIARSSTGLDMSMQTSSNIAVGWSSQLSLNLPTNVNVSGNTYVAYLFATCAGVSKVGSYTGTGALQTINCGFTGGARFVLIKRTDSTGDWYVYDSARGISSGNDPYLFLNSTAAEVTGTNYVDTTSVGFQVTAAAPAGLNANGGTYIFLAIA